jgi:hypothetical protein
MYNVHYSTLVLRLAVTFRPTAPYAPQPLDPISTIT